MDKEASFPLVTVAWLATAMRKAKENKIVILDASYHLPGSGRDGQDEFLAEHIPSARFFDVEAISDTSSPYPHMAPSSEIFTQHVNALGIDNQSLIIVYDSHGLFSAGRAWWMFRLFGHDNVGILDGGLRAWQSMGLPIETGEPPIPEPYGKFKASFRKELVRNKDEVMDALLKSDAKLIDVRPPERFSGAKTEPRPGLRAGHMPGAINIPYATLTNPETGYIRSFDELRTTFAYTGVLQANQIITTCGSGITSAALSFVLHLLGKQDVPVYDGSWAEWGALNDTPVVRGDS